jgi:hypothetical protein
MPKRQKPTESGDDNSRTETILLNGRIGWVDEDDIESAGEKRPLVYSPN